MYLIANDLFAQQWPADTTILSLRIWEPLQNWCNCCTARLIEFMHDGIGIDDRHASVPKHAAHSALAHAWITDSGADLCALMQVWWHHEAVLRLQQHSTVDTAATTNACSLADALVGAAHMQGVRTNGTGQPQLQADLVGHRATSHTVARSKRAAICLAGCKRSASEP